MEFIIKQMVAFQYHGGTITGNGEKNAGISNYSSGQVTITNGTVTGAYGIYNNAKGKITVNRRNYNRNI